MAALIYLFALVLVCGKAFSLDGVLNSPCPNVFHYERSQNGDWQGRVSIIPPIQFSKAKLQLKMTVNYFPLTGGVGKITFNGGKQEVILLQEKHSE